MSLGGCDDELRSVKIFCAGGLTLFIFGLITVFIGSRDAPSLEQVMLRRTPAKILGAIALLRRTQSA